MGRGGAWFVGCGGRDFFATIDARTGSPCLRRTVQVGDVPVVESIEFEWFWRDVYQF